MSLKHAILGFLNISPLSGYDLWKMFNSTVNNYWTATNTQIYRTLSELAEENMVWYEVIQQEGVPNKKLYHLTQEGKEELISWLRTPLELPSIRHKLLVQISFSNLLEDEEIIAILETYMKNIKEKLNSYKHGNQEEYLSFASSERERFLWKMVLKNGIGFYEFELKWLKESIEEFKKMEKIKT